MDQWPNALVRRMCRWRSGVVQMSAGRRNERNIDRGSELIAWKIYGTNIRFQKRHRHRFNEVKY